MCLNFTFPGEKCLPDSFSIYFHPHFRDVIPTFTQFPLDCLFNMPHQINSICISAKIIGQSYIHIR